MNDQTESTKPAADPFYPAPAAAPTVQSEPQPELVEDDDNEVTGADRLRAFEDEHISEDAPRHNGQIEKGHGSLFKRLSDEHRAHHAALEELVAAEAAHQSAAAAMQAADEALEAAIRKADATEEAVPPPEDEPAAAAD